MYQAATFNFVTSQICQQKWISQNFVHAKIIHFARVFTLFINGNLITHTQCTRHLINSKGQKL